ncbi:hypothetical protein [Paraburkholderia nodosa]|uniref:hypothetical protein n=1 Tax=Paraburkholderia nodosa TaxID=392320 RepID=UPI0012B68382|nr:hypothetical protein [Paraburkholderia nodosa]
MLRHEISHGIFNLRLTAAGIDLSQYPGLSVLGLMDEEDEALGGQEAVEGQRFLVRGDAQVVARLANDLHLAIREPYAESQAVTNALFNRSSGLAEVVIPQRSALIGQAVFGASSQAWLARYSASAFISRRCL